MTQTASKRVHLLIQGRVQGVFYRESTRVQAQALGLSFTTSTLALAFMLSIQGHLTWGTSLASAIAVVPAVLGMALGQVIRGEMGEASFRRCFFAGLLLLGGWLLVR